MLFILKIVSILEIILIFDKTLTEQLLLALILRKNFINNFFGCF